MVIRSIHGAPGMVFLGYDTDGECLWGTPKEKLNMGIPLDSDWNDIPAKIEDDMTDAGKANQPKERRGGILAPADYTLIKDALSYYTRLDISDAQQRQIANLLHRLNNRT